MRNLPFLRSVPRKELLRFGKFLVVGAVGFMVDFGGFNIIHHFFGVREVIAQAMSFSLATLSNFLWNYLWIYPEARNSNQTRKSLQFIFVSVVGLVIGVPIFSGALFVARIAVNGLGLGGLTFNLAGNAALVCRVFVLLFWNFFANRKWTYGEVPVT